ncbi:MAG: sigma-54-dependent transcriptional regulator [Bdellovibrio bacteriovorus]
MSGSQPIILIVEDSRALAEVYRSYLTGEPYQVRHVADGRRALAELDREPPAVLLLSLRLPDMDGMAILRRVHERQIPTAVVVIAVASRVDLAVDAMRYGAFDVVDRPFGAKRIKVTLRNALERQRLTSLAERADDDLRRDHYHGFIGSSPPLQAVYRTIDSAAPSRATIFITGESGTGKELCAEAIHRQSGRREGPFVALNCGAIPRDLMESEIFGHVRGAFTGATRNRLGAAEQAHGGTLFLDEIAELDLDLQTKLLRFVQTGCIQRVGSTELAKVDVRIICATNRDPEQEVAEGRFRQDLYYRLHVIPIHLPPLRERPDDIGLLANHFLRTFAAEEGKGFRALAPEAEAVFLDYDWPGNIRQLQNVIRNVVVLHDGEQVTRAMLPAPLDGAVGGSRGVLWDRARGGAPERDPMRERTILPLHVLEKEAIERAICLCEGNIPRAAALLEVSPSTLYRKRQAWGSRGV